MGNPTYFTDDIARASRQAEVPLASFINGGNFAGSNAVGLGINIDEGEVVGTPNQFTLLDQFGNARAAQRSQFIGGSPFTDPADYPSSGGEEGTLPAAVIYSGTNPTEAEKEATPGLDGTPTKVGNATLAVLATGWTAE